MQSDDQNQDAVAQSPLDMYRQGVYLYSQKKWEESYQAMERCTSSGFPLAFFAQGLFLHQGLGCPRDESRGQELQEQGLHHEDAFSLSMMESEKDDPLAQFALSRMLYRGWGTDENHSLSMKYTKQAAEHGVSLAQFTFGWMVERGRDDTADPATCEEWYQKAADQGLAEGQLALAKFWLERGREGDHVKARKFAESAAQQGLTEAQELLVDWDKSIQDPPEEG